MTFLDPAKLKSLVDLPILGRGRVGAEPCTEAQRAQRLASFYFWPGDFHRNCLSAARGCHVYGLALEDHVFRCFLCTDFRLGFKRSVGWNTPCCGWDDFRRNRGIDMPAARVGGQLQGMTKVKRALAVTSTPAAAASGAASSSSSTCRPRPASADADARRGHRPKLAVPVDAKLGFVAKPRSKR